MFYLEITSTSPSVCACLFMVLSRQRGRRSCKHSHKHTCVCVGVYYGCTPADQEDHNKMSVNSVILENKISQISCDSVVCVCVCCSLVELFYSVPSETSSKPHEEVECEPIWSDHDCNWKYWRLQRGTKERSKKT